MTQLKVGIAGYGIVGKRRRVCIDRNPNLNLIAVCDRQFDGRGSFPNGVLYFENYKELLEENIDVLFVCMSNEIAPEVTIAGLM